MNKRIESCVCCGAIGVALRKGFCGGCRAVGCPSEGIGTCLRSVIAPLAATESVICARETASGSKAAGERPWQTRVES